MPVWMALLFSNCVFKLLCCCSLKELFHLTADTIRCIRYQNVKLLCLLYFYLTAFLPAVIFKAPKPYSFSPSPESLILLKAHTLHTYTYLSWWFLISLYLPLGHGYSAGTCCLLHTRKWPTPFPLHKVCLLVTISCDRCCLQIR